MFKVKKNVPWIGTRSANKKSKNNVNKYNISYQESINLKDVRRKIPDSNHHAKNN